MAAHICKRSSSALVTERGRSNRPKSETRRRTQIVAVRMTPDELAEAQALAAAHGMSVPDLMRSAVVAVQLDEARRSVQ